MYCLYSIKSEILAASAKEAMTCHDFVEKT
jgi:hypothetical protein